MQYKKARVGRSTISGWGMFLLEDVKKRDFIMEYKGL
jgi:SET domain-containing protein